MNIQFDGIDEANISSMSGGKDSTAQHLLAIERETPNLFPAFCDTGHEHRLTYEYVDYLDNWLVQRGYQPIRRLKADFSAEIARKRERLTAWLNGAHDARNAASKHPWKEEHARRAVELLQPTGVPFLDMCLARGFFPSTRRRFCSEELKQRPMEAFQGEFLQRGIDVISWQGVRADESPKRAVLSEREAKGFFHGGAELTIYRPILKWTAQDCFDMHKRHGVKHNPLYELGMGRVGCMPCIHTGKDELLEISKRFPDELARVHEWERLVTEANPRGHDATFFSTDVMSLFIPTEEVNYREHGIWRAVQWSQTARGGKQVDMLRLMSEPTVCSSIYGLCE